MQVPVLAREVLRLRARWEEERDTAAPYALLFYDEREKVLEERRQLALVRTRPPPSNAAAAVAAASELFPASQDNESGSQTELLVRGLALIESLKDERQQARHEEALEQLERHHEESRREKRAMFLADQKRRVDERVERMRLEREQREYATLTWWAQFVSTAAALLCVASILGEFHTMLVEACLLELDMGFLGTRFFSLHYLVYIVATVVLFVAAQVPYGVVLPVAWALLQIPEIFSRLLVAVTAYMLPYMLLKGGVRNRAVLWSLWGADLVAMPIITRFL